MPSPERTNTGAASALHELLTVPYIQSVIHLDQKTPRSVLSFFFGVDYSNENDVQEKMVQGNSIWQMQSLWFGGGKGYDSVCFQHFSETIRQAGRGNYKKADEWSRTIDGLMAQLILCDQLSRSAFRGMPETYIYDEAALHLARQLSNHILQFNSLENDKERHRIQKDNRKCDGIRGKVYPVYISVIVLALTHSENIQDHYNALELLQHAKAMSPPSLLKWWKLQQDFAMQHKQVVEKFNRYPHRNELKGRRSTEKELNWLADVDNLPVWAQAA